MEEWEALLLWLERHVKVWKRFWERYPRLRDKYRNSDILYQHFLRHVLPKLHEKVVQLRCYVHKQAEQEGTYFTVRRYDYLGEITVEKHWVPVNQLERVNPPKMKKLVTWKMEKERRLQGVFLILEEPTMVV